MLGSCLPLCCKNQGTAPTDIFASNCNASLDLFLPLASTIQHQLLHPACPFCSTILVERLNTTNTEDIVGHFHQETGVPCEVVGMRRGGIFVGHFAFTQGIELIDLGGGITGAACSNSRTSPPPSPLQTPQSFRARLSPILRFWGKGLVPKAPKIFFALPEGVFFFYPMCVYTKNTQNFAEKSKMFEKHRKIFDP